MQFSFAKRSGKFAPRAAAVILAATLLLRAPSMSQDLTGNFGDWILMADDKMSLALTTDGDQTAFGLICASDCEFYIESREPCAEQRPYPVRIEAGSQGYSSTMTCKAAGGGPLLMMPYDDRFLGLIAGKENVTLTVTREVDMESRFRFPLAGGAKAIGLALAARAYIEPSETGVIPEPPVPGTTGSPRTDQRMTGSRRSSWSIAETTSVAPEQVVAERPEGSPRRKPPVSSTYFGFRVGT